MGQKIFLPELQGGLIRDLIVNRRKLHRFSVPTRPICVWQKHGEICLFLPILGTLSIDDEMGQRRRPEVKFSRPKLLGMRKVVKTSSSLRRRNSGRFAVVAKT